MPLVPDAGVVVVFIRLRTGAQRHLRLAGERLREHGHKAGAVEVHAAGQVRRRQCRLSGIREDVGVIAVFGDLEIQLIGLGDAGGNADGVGGVGLVEHQHRGQSHGGLGRGPVAGLHQLGDVVVGAQGGAVVESQGDGGRGGQGVGRLAQGRVETHVLRQRRAEEGLRLVGALAGGAVGHLPAPDGVVRAADAAEGQGQGIRHVLPALHHQHRAQAAQGGIAIGVIGAQSVGAIVRVRAGEGDGGTAAVGGGLAPGGADPAQLHPGVGAHLVIEVAEGGGVVSVGGGLGDVDGAVRADTRQTVVAGGGASENRQAALKGDAGQVGAVPEGAAFDVARLGLTVRKGVLILAAGLRQGHAGQVGAALEGIGADAPQVRGHDDAADGAAAERGTVQVVELRAGGEVDAGDAGVLKGVAVQELQGGGHLVGAADAHPLQGGVREDALKNRGQPGALRQSHFLQGGLARLGAEGVLGDGPDGGGQLHVLDVRAVLGIVQEVPLHIRHGEGVSRRQAIVDAGILL